MLLDPVTFDLLPRAAEVVARARDSLAVKGELPASQVELVTPPAHTVAEAVEALTAIRRRALAAAHGIGYLGAAGVHPFAGPEGELTAGPRYERTVSEYGFLARLQLIFGLHVHVAVRPVERALAVYNELRSHLPELAAVASNSPFYLGADTGLQSIRPKINEMLPRQGVPPAFGSVEDLAEALGWSARAGGWPGVRQWWWEARLHPWLGTVEVRVCDAQTGVAETAALAALIQSLCVWLADRYDCGDLPQPAATWRIEENRWSACRHGVHGTLADVRTGVPVPTRDRISALLAELAPTAARLGCAEELEGVTALLASPPADRQRAVAAEVGPRGVARWLAARFVEHGEDRA